MNHEQIWNYLVEKLKEFYQEAGVPLDKDTLVVLGLSGGLDSAVVGALAADAFGGDKVLAVTMPSQYSTDKTGDEAAQIAKALGVRLVSIPIWDTYDLMLSQIEKTDPSLFQNWTTTQENLQARIRGTILMTLANAHGALVLNTGNKSEEMVGYFTLYGDSVGAFAPIANVYKSDLYPLCEWRNKVQRERTGEDFILQSVLDKAPSAELAPDQKDEDSLPPYPVLDDILRVINENIVDFTDNGTLVLDEQNILERTKATHSTELVLRVCSLVKKNAFKALQVPPGPLLP